MQLQEELPGLELQPADAGTETDIVRATQIAIDDLNEQKLLERRHLALCQLALDQARMLQKALNNPGLRLTAITGLMDSYRETMAALPVPEIANRGKFEACLETMPSRQLAAVS